MVEMPQIGRNLAHKRAHKQQEPTPAAPACPPQGALAALMEEWRQEDATDDPAL